MKKIILGILLAGTQVAHGAATITANPAVISIPQGSLNGSTHITWNAPGYGWINIQKSTDGGPLAGVAGGGTSGSFDVDWIGVGHQYAFYVYPALQPDGHPDLSNRLAAVTVSGTRATLTATPAVVSIPAGSLHGTTTISWNAPGYSWLNVQEATDGGALAGVGGGGTTGSFNVDWIAAGHSYAFHLYPALQPDGHPDLAHLLASVTVTAGSPPPAPVVSVTAPSAGATFAAGSTIAIGANASVSSGSISKVEFYAGSSLLGTDTVAPYSYNWVGVASGNYNLSAKAYGSLGGVATSAGVPVTVALSSGSISANPPVVQIAPDATSRNLTLAWQMTNATSGKIVQACNGSTATVASNTAASGSMSVPIAKDVDCTYTLLDQASNRQLATTTAKSFEYDISVDYHDYTLSSSGSFLAQYHNASVRSQVLSQLNQMAAGGATSIFTRVWLVGHPANSGYLQNEYWRWHFPPTAQELANLTLYAKDVGAITSSAGTPLKLDVSILYGLGYSAWCVDRNADGKCTDTTEIAGDSPNCDPAVPTCNGAPNPPQSVSTYSSRVTTSYQSIIDALASANQQLPAKKPARRVYFHGELINSNPNNLNTDWLVRTFYPPFYAYANARSITPTTYFITTPDETSWFLQGGVCVSSPGILASSTDPQYPVLNNHRSMFWPYRTLKFWKDNGIPIPELIEMSMYPTPNQDHLDSPTIYGDLISRVVSDAEAVLPGLLGRTTVKLGAAETYYPVSASRRTAVAQAFLANALPTGGRNLRRVSVWTDPYSPPSCPLGALPVTPPIAYPTTMIDYRLN